MFRIVNLDKEQEVEKQTSLTVLDDQEMKFYLGKEQEYNWQYIKKIVMRNSYCTIKSIEDLCSKAVSFGVDELDLSRNFNTVNNMTLDLLQRSEHLRNLRVLDLSDTAVTDEGLDKYLSSENCKKLEKLIFYGDLEITSKTLFSIAASRTCQRLKHLDFRCTAIDNMGVRELVIHKNCQLLTYLDISSNFESITDDSLKDISDSQQLKFLRVLKVANCAITDQGIWYLTTSSVCAELEELDVSNEKDIKYNKITNVALQHLSQQDSATSDEGLSMFFVSPNVLQLKWLKVSCCENVSGTSLIKLIDAVQTNCEQLEKFYVNDTSVEAKDIKIFVDKCPHIELVYNSDINLEELKQSQRLIMSQRNK